METSGRDTDRIIHDPDIGPGVYTVEPDLLGAEPAKAKEKAATTLNLQDLISKGQMVPVGGIWFSIEKIDGPYLMLKATGMTTKLKRAIRGR